MAKGDVLLLTTSHKVRGSVKRRFSKPINLVVSVAKKKWHEPAPGKSARLKPKHKKNGEKFMNIIKNAFKVTAAAGAAVSLAIAAGNVMAVDFDNVWDRTDWPSTIRIGVLPEEDQSVMEQRYAPLQAHFEEVLGVDVRLFFGTDFSAMVEAMRFGNIEASKFGPFAYILASERANAEAIVQGAADRFAPTYLSYIITRSDTGINSLEDLEDRNFGWVDPASASGYLFPRAHMLGELEHLGIDNDSIDQWFGNVIFTGGHDASVRAVISGDIDAASVSDSQITRMQAANIDGMENIVIVSETDPIPRSPEAVRGDLPESLKAAISYAYLSFNDQQFLQAHNYHHGFITVDDAAYNVVRRTQQLLGLD